MKMKNKTKTLLLAMSVALTLSGCQATRVNSYTGEEETSSATTGAILGCATGAIIGGVIKGGKGAALGCAAGGGTGLLIGNNMDQQENELRNQLVNTGVQVRRDGQKLTLLMKGDVSFDSGSARLSNSIKPALNSVAKVLEKYKDSDLVITGHTDAKGSDSSNQSLSEARAKSVEVYLASNGVPFSRMNTVGMGEYAPVCANNTEEGRACNRRVELTITPRK